MSVPATSALPPSCSSDGFETVATLKKQKKRSDSNSKSLKVPPPTSRCSNVQQAASSSRNNSSASFGRASWAKPKQKSSISTNKEKPEWTNVPMLEQRTVPEHRTPYGNTKDNDRGGLLESQSPTNPGEVDFRATSTSLPLSALLSEYGEQDLDWQKVMVPQCPSALVDESLSHSDQSRHNSRLGMRGKAPIHIEFVSFGYLHGAPVEFRNGWSHAQPLAPWDARELVSTRVPHYLAWQDGLSGAVKRAFLGADGSRLRELSRTMAEQVAASMVEAMDHGGHGYAFPLHAKVYVGSELGRHRSVVLTELAATSLRRILRANSNNSFSCPCSVETSHRDIERKQSHDKTNKSKQKGLEDD